MKKLLQIIEQGGYPDFAGLYASQGIEVTTVKSVRKAIALLKKEDFDFVTAEFNYQTDFRDRTSSLESILATIQRKGKTRVIIFIDKQNQENFIKVSSRFPIHQALTFPVSEGDLKQAVSE